MLVLNLPYETVLLANLIILVLALLAGLLILRASIRYNRNIGNYAIQDKLKFTIIRYIMFIISLGLLASALNLFFT